VRGLLAWDCGHNDPSYGSKSEIHPPVALAWLHPVSPRDCTLFVKALSHAPDPSETHHLLDSLAATFAVPGYDPTVPVYVGPPAFDYDVTAASTC
jgi:hypothetical protein